MDSVGSRRVHMATDLWRDAGSDARFQMGKRKGTACSRSWHFVQTVSLLAFIGIASSLAGEIMDLVTNELFELRFMLTGMPYRNSTGGIASSEGGHGKIVHPNWIVYFLWGCTLMIISWCTVHFVSPLASGSGIPRMKSVLSGIYMHRFLSLRSLICKEHWSGRCLCRKSFDWGREGPYVHIACCIAKLLMKTPMYNRYAKSSSRHTDMLTVACAAGVATAFGTPFGGVIFAVEVVTMYFYVPNLPRMFFAAICGTFIVKVLGESDGYIAMFKTEFDASQSISWISFVVFVLLGIVCGIASGIFIRLLKLAKLRRIWLPPDSRTGQRAFFEPWASSSLCF